jgi:cytochrome c-type biogenesis protein CcmH
MLKKIYQFFILNLLVIFFSSFVYASNADLYSFNSSQQAQQFKNMSEELRCLVCQNQNIADSNAPLAKDLRTQVYKMIMQGKSNEEIKNYLVARYGNFILFKPPVTQATYILWFWPLIALLIALALISKLCKFTKTKNEKI